MVFSAAGSFYATVGRGVLIGKLPQNWEALKVISRRGYKWRQHIHCRDFCLNENFYEDLEALKMDEDKHFELFPSTKVPKVR